MSELLPCPFCGKEGALDQWPCEWLDARGANVIRCVWCHGAAPAKTWNRRAPVPASDARGDWVLVPREPTEAMLEAGRSAVMARDCSGPSWGPADHYRAAGIDRAGIPDRLFEGRQKMSKAWGAELVYAAMIAAHTQAGPVDE